MSDLTERIVDLRDRSFSKGAIKRMHLLAASAGTGKTYSIQTLYLRLILIEGLTVQQILVVTFTKDATKELRDRLQRVLREALDHLNGAVQAADLTDRTKKLVDVATGDAGAATMKQRLQLALLDFDMAAIYTIHSFCQRVLNRFAFETRQPFDVEPAGDTSDEIEQLCKDWWRRNIYPMDEKLTGCLSGSGEFTLKAITTLARKLIGKPDAKLLPEVGAQQSIEDKMPELFTQFVAANPPLAEETKPYPAARAEVGRAVLEIQQQIKKFRASVAAREWGAAVEALLSATGFERDLSTLCQVEARDLAAACAAFKEQIPPRTQVKTFKYDGNGCLASDKCPGLTSEHTRSIKSAIDKLQLVDKIRQYEPFSLASKKAFGSTVLLCRHLGACQECAASELVEAIKVIAKDGAGMVEKVKITVDAINPEFSRLRDALFAECANAVPRAALQVKEQYRQGRPAAATASFDDYLVNLRDALTAEPAGREGGLVDVLRREFQAALIDEFQDTDPIQWGIFEKLFKNAGIPCFLVGDPKQAIYRFRNGDVATYIKATASVPGESQYLLDTNHRSEQRLIDAVNQVFMDGSGQSKTFGDQIDYAVPLAAKGKDVDKSLLVKGAIDPRPFKIVLIENSSRCGRLPSKNSPSAWCAYRLTAAEVAGLLNDKAVTIGDRPVRRKDIAILVNRHVEGDCIARELGKLGIPTVRQGTGDVWETDEGQTLWVVLEAVLDSRNLSNVRRALLSAWFGLTAEQIRELNEGGKVRFSAGGTNQDYRLEDWVCVFAQLREAWLKRGFPAMFRKLTGTIGLKTRLLGLQDQQGQRRLANINHLCELVEQTIVDGRKTPEGTLAWIRRQFDEETADGGEEVKLRLETDDDAVRIMTIFASKGLEFPIVFAPTLFMMAPYQRDGVYEYHDAHGNLCVVKKVDKDPQSEEAKKREKDEMLLEQVRKIYVALTRAVHRTVIVALDDGEADGKANKGEVQAYRMRGILGQVLRLPMRKMEDKAQSERIGVDLDQVDARFTNITGVLCAVEVVRDTGLSMGGAVQPDSTTVDREPARNKPRPDTSRGHGSFSSLAPREQKQSEAVDGAVVVDMGSKNRDGETVGVAPEQMDQKPEGIFAFPAGARTGTCWHEIFEDLAFDASDEEIQKMVEAKLGIHGFLKNAAKKDERLAVTAQMVRNVLRKPLPGLNGSAPFALKTVSNEDRKTEWEFSFAALSGKKTRELRDVIVKYEPYKQLIEGMGEWDRAIPGGYLTGFVDLLFRKDGRYYIVDWKSNRRSGRQSDFGWSGLREEMASHSYWLQYLIYTVAVHQYLAKALEGYSYAEHFGGVYYLFLRGVDENRADGHTNGIYEDRPPEALVVELAGILGDFS